MSTQPGSKSSPQRLGTYLDVAAERAGLQPGNAKIHPLGIGKGKQGSLAICAGILGRPFPTRPQGKTGAMFGGLGRGARRKGVSDIGGQGVGIAHHQNPRRGKSPWSVRISPEFGRQFVVAPENMPLPPRIGMGANSSTCWRRSFPSGHMQKAETRSCRHRRKRRPCPVRSETLAARRPCNGARPSRGWT